MSIFIRKYPAISLLILAVIFGTLPSLPVATGMLPPAGAQLGALSASLAAIMLVLVEGRKCGLRELLGRVLIWRGVVAYVVLRREVKPFSWEGLRDRLWLYMPSRPGTGVRSKWLYFWIIPFVVLGQANGVFKPFGWLNELWVEIFPCLAPRPYAVIDNMAGPAVGQWWLLGVLAVDIVFNYLLGEELIFRGILLPKMNGVFGKWDWLANHLLFSAYHLHYLWTMPSRLLINWIYAWPTKRFKSYWMGVVIHGSDAVFLTYMFIMAIKGLV